MVKQKTNYKNKVGSSKEKIALLGAIAFIILALSAITLCVLMPNLISAQRKNRILETYAKINLGDDYIVQSQNIFGEKKLYEWDTSRTYSSSEELIRGADVDTTVSDLQGHITRAGFTLVDHPYPFQWQYKSNDNIYIRFNVDSKPRMEYAQNQSLMGKSFDPTFNNISPDAGPSLVTLKVNLDDNNE